jgi:hypothetical protein
LQVGLQPDIGLPRIPVGVGLKSDPQETSHAFPWVGLQPNDGLARNPARVGLEFDLQALRRPALWRPGFSPTAALPETRFASD